MIVVDSQVHVWPPDRPDRRHVVTHFTEELDFLSAADLEWIMGRGLVECLRWTI
jgi:hypothetical protein